MLLGISNKQTQNLFNFDGKWNREHTGNDECSTTFAYFFQGQGWRSVCFNFFALKKNQNRNRAWIFVCVRVCDWLTSPETKSKI